LLALSEIHDICIPIVRKPGHSLLWVAVLPLFPKGRHTDVRITLARVLRVGIDINFEGSIHPAILMSRARPLSARRSAASACQTFSPSRSPVTVMVFAGGKRKKGHCEAGQN